MAEFADLAVRFGINVIAMVILLYGIYYPRHGDRALVTMAAIFNILSFAVLGKISNVEFGLAAGFGLFAILALFSLRSIQIGRIEIAYFFGAVGLAVICSIEGETAIKNAAVSFIVVASVYVIDHPRLLRRSSVIRVTLDGVDPQILARHGAIEEVASQRLGVQVTSLDLISINLIKKQAVVDLSYEGSLPPDRVQANDSSHPL